MATGSKLQDQELLERIAQDDQRAFDLLYNRYWNKVLQLAAHKLGDIMEAENIVQDVFISLWNRRNRLQINGNLENYLVVSVKYRVITALNKRKSQRLYECGQAEDMDILDDSTRQYLAFEELRQRLEVLIGQLPAKSQLVYRLNKEQGLSYKEIAAELDITEKSVEAYLSRAKKSLASGLGSFLTSFLL